MVNGRLGLSLVLDLFKIKISLVLGINVIHSYNIKSKTFLLSSVPSSPFRYELCHPYFDFFFTYIFRS